MQFGSLDGEDPLEDVMATLSSILAWRLPWTKKPGGQQSIGSQSQDRLKPHMVKFKSLISTSFTFLIYKIDVNNVSKDQIMLIM